MREKAAAYIILFLLLTVILCSCGKEAGKVQIQISALQDVISWEHGVVWNTEKDIFSKRVSEAERESIFQDPFYEKEEGEEVALQYIEQNQLYYIRVMDEQYYELCSMDLTTYQITVLYTNASKAERTYHYLGIQNKTAANADERKDVMDKVVRQFCKIGDTIYMLIDDTLYQMNVWTKYRKKIIEKLDSDTELVFLNSKIYYKNTDKILMEYDRDSGINNCLSDWMVQKLSCSGGSLLIQRMNGELYRYCEGKEPEKILSTHQHLLHGDEKFFYCSKNNGNQLVVYNINTLQQEKVINGEHIWGVASVTQSTIYYLESREDYLVLKNTGC